MDTAPLEALYEAIRKAGSQAALAAALGVKPPSVVCWINAQRVPEDRCPEIERLFGVPCERLRPDIDWRRDDDTGAVVGKFVPIAATA